MVASKGSRKRAGNFDGGAVARFLLAMKMALQFHIDVAVAKDAGQTFHRATRLLHPTLRQRNGERTIIPAGEADQSGRMLLQFFFANSAFTLLLCAQFHLCDQAAEILVAGAGRDEKGKAERIADIRGFQIGDW